MRDDETDHREVYRAADKTGELAPHHRDGGVRGGHRAHCAFVSLRPIGNP